MPMRYSRRVYGTPEPTREPISDDERCRIMNIVQRNTDYRRGARAFEGTLLEMYPSLRSPSFSFVRGETLTDHFRGCDDIEAIEFLETLFQVIELWGEDIREFPEQANLLVAKLNDLFVEQGLVWRLTECSVKSDPTDAQHAKLGRAFALAAAALGRPRDLSKSFNLPQIYRASDAYSQTQVVEPTLKFLSDPRFQVANDEMLKALVKHRVADYAGVLTDAGSAFESVLKTVCMLNGWTYDPDRDTLSKLLDICRDKGLFPREYHGVLMGAGTIRNRFSSAHGRGPEVRFTPTKDEAEHFLHMVSSHILYVAKLAGV